MSISVALQVYSVREAAKADLGGTLKKIKEMGYEGIELAGLYGHSVQDVKKMCEELGLTPISAHVPYRDMIADPEGVLGDYAALGCKFVVIPYLREEYRPSGDRFGEVIANARMLGGIANRLGMRLLYHNHDFEFMKLDGKYALDILYDEVSADLLATELDTCWVRVGGEDPVKYIDKYARRAPIVHLKDYVGGRTEGMYALIGIDREASADVQKFAFRPVGDGVQDFPAILDACERAGTEWVVVEQDSPSLDLSEIACAAKSRDYLRSIGY